MAPNIPHFPVTHTFALSPPTLDQGQSMWPAEHGRSKSKSLLGLGYKRYIAAFMWASLSLSLSVPTLPPWVDLGLLNSNVGKNIMRQHLNILAKNYFQPKTLVPVKLSTKGEARIKIFSDIHRLKKFISDGPLSQELLAACAWPIQGTKSWQTEPRVEETEFPAQVRSEGNPRRMAIQWARTGWSESTENSKSPFLLGRRVGG